MFSHWKNISHKNFLSIALTAVFILAGSATLADQGMGHDMKSDGNDQMKMHREMHNAKMGIGPHNAAGHFLTMKSTLKLTGDQVKQLTQLRDDYIKDNAEAEEQVSAAYSDLPNLLYADDVDTSAANDLVDKITKLESQLWHAYTKQLHDIKAILTPEQKKILADSWAKDHGNMGRKHGDMPMTHDKKSSTP
jgi:Spy/CpxP family protein refolding chaperone